MDRTPDDDVARVLAFRRSRERRPGIPREDLRDGGFTPAEGRVLAAIARRPGTTAAVLAADLALDPGYLSRILREFEGRALVARRRSERDRRERRLTLAPAGAAAVADLDGRARREVEGMLAGLAPGEREDLLEAMDGVRGILGGGEEAPEPIRLRDLRSGDVGTIVRRHGLLYRREFGWDLRFEALVAGIVGRFAADHDRARERAWVAEAGGRFAGCVLLVRESRSTARLRCLLVEPFARGRGLGRRLVAACLRFARRAGYRRMVLWTNAELRAAARLYRAAGFRPVGRERGRRFGRATEFQTWERDLRPSAPGRRGSRGGGAGAE